MDGNVVSVERVIAAPAPALCQIDGMTKTLATLAARAESPTAG
jgi:hypothetical protein